MIEISAVLQSVKARSRDRLSARKVFLAKRNALWNKIQDGRIPDTYHSVGDKKFVGAPRRTAIRCDFLLANKIALGPKYKRDRLADLAQRDLLFSVLRYREVFPNRVGSKFYCCPKCTGKLYECVSANAFLYIDNAKWRAEIETQGKTKRGTARASKKRAKRQGNPS